MVQKQMLVFSVAVAIMVIYPNNVLTEPWKPLEDDDSGGTTLLDHYFVHHFDHEEPDSELAASYALRALSINCECVKLRHCPKILEMLRTPKSSYSNFNSKLKRLTCGYNTDREPNICCPLDDTWLSDDVDARPQAGLGFGDQRNSFDEPNNFKYLKNDRNRFGSSNRNSARNNFVTSFEDPETMKNCPPVISSADEFDRPTTKVYVAPAVRRRPTTTTSTTTMTPRRLVLSGTRTAITPITSNPIIDPNASLVSPVSPPVINDALCGLSVNTRIIGGETEIPGQFPWIARLAYRNRTSGRITYRCAGSLITNRHVITVAHCVTNLIDELQLVNVRLGDLECNSVTDNRCNSRFQDFAIERLMPHQNYDTPKYANDIAVVKLQQATEIFNILSPLCLPMDQYSSYGRNLTGKTGIIAGWGSTSNRSNSPSPTLQWLRLPIVDTAQCATSYARYSVNSRNPIIVSGSQMCVQGQENMDACQGDSGGPLMNEAISSRDRFVLLGLVSFGPRTCGVSNFPGVYTRISSYIDWIQRQVEL
ncbi:CLIP domain-containing serine protease B9 [Armigeres subalbatus]|uniref:CLIP domain-containing serine protease B9 n=1 Tax=Armigeres subalbatus TaxID=124917 RepID=UPI002ED57514